MERYKNVLKKCGIPIHYSGHARTFVKMGGSKNLDLMFDDLDDPYVEFKEYFKGEYVCKFRPGMPPFCYGHTIVCYKVC